MSPANRSLALGLLLVLVGTVAAAVGTIQVSRRQALASTRHNVATGAKLLATLERMDMDNLVLRAQALADDPAFVDYVAQSLIPNPQLGGAIDSASIIDQLNERRHGYDVALVLDPAGKPAGMSGLLTRSAADIAKDPLVRRAIASQQPVQGYWLDNDRLLRVAIAPLLRGRSLQGLLVAARHVGVAFSDEVHDTTSVDLALLSTSSPTIPLVFSGAAPPSSTEFTRLRGAALSTSGAPKALRVVGWPVAYGLAVPVSNGRAAWLLLPSAGGAPRTVPRKAVLLLSGVACLGLLAALGIVWLWWRTWLPLERMLYIVDRAAAGDGHMTLRTGGSALVRQLRDCLNRLIHQNRSS
ncbi:MAG: hypothetical protein KGI63_07340 [Xanthomonadaceae bacterium]|nr:hypothetical protein [Xanthomonadaceae bacterium]